MDKLRQTLTSLYYKIDAMYYELTDLDCELFVSVQREEQIKEILSLYDQFKQGLSAFLQTNWGDAMENTNDEPITLLSPIIDAWILVQVIDEQLFDETINIETLKEFNLTMEQLSMVSTGLLV